MNQFVVSLLLPGLRPGIKQQMKSSTIGLGQLSSSAAKRTFFSLGGRNGGLPGDPAQQVTCLSIPRPLSAQNVLNWWCRAVREATHLLCGHVRMAPKPHGTCPAQVEHLKQLNHGSNAEEVIKLFEGGRVAFTQDTLGEYIKALSRMDRLDNSRLMGLLQVCVCVCTRMCVRGNSDLML